MITLLITLFIVLAILGLLLWGVSQIPGIPPVVKTVVYVITGVILLILLLQYVQGGHVPLLR
jgi:hypothetical protein